MVTEGSVSNIEIQPTLMERIKEAQHGHPSIEGIKRKVSLGKASEFNVHEQVQRKAMRTKCQGPQTADID